MLLNFMLFLYRKRRPNNHQEMNKEPVQSAKHLSDVTRDVKAESPDGLQVNPHSSGTTVTSPDDTTPNVSLEDLYTKPNKQKKLHKNVQDSQNASDYACVYGHVKAELMDEHAGMTGSGNEELDYIEIDHRGTEGATRDVGPQPESETVTYAEIQPKTTSADTTPQDDDTDTTMVENVIYS